MYTPTSKHQVTIPKAMREHMKLKPKQAVDFEPLPDGSVRMFVTTVETEENPFRKYVGIGLRKRPTDEIMRETRGEDWNR